MHKFIARTFVFGLLSVATVCATKQVNEQDGQANQPLQSWAQVKQAWGNKTPEEIAEMREMLIGMTIWTKEDGDGNVVDDTAKYNVFAASVNAQNLNQ